MPTRTRSQARTDDLQLLIESLREAIKKRFPDTVEKALKAIETTLEERLEDADAEQASPLKRIKIQLLELNAQWALSSGSIRFDGRTAADLLDQAMPIAMDIGDAEQSMVLSMKWTRLQLLRDDVGEADQAEAYNACSETVGQYEQFHKTIDTPAYAHAITAMAVYLYRFGDRRAAKAKLRYAKRFLGSRRERRQYHRDVSRMHGMTGHNFRREMHFIRAKLIP